MEADWNVLAKHWADSHFRLGPIVKFTREPGKLSTAYRTTSASFTITKRGTGRLLLDAYSYELMPGTVVHSGPGLSLQAWNTGEETFECYRVLYETQSIGNASSREEPFGHYQLKIGDNPYIYTLLDQMCEVSTQGDIPSGLHVKSLFYQFLNELRISSTKSQAFEHRTMIEETVAFIHQHIRESHSLLSLSRRYGMSPKYFSGLFFKVTGVSPIHYIVRYRIKLAEKLLLTTNASIREIGRSVGYNDPYQFSKIFKKYRGIAPNAMKSGGRTEGEQD